MPLAAQSVRKSGRPMQVDNGKFFSVSYDVFPEAKRKNQLVVPLRNASGAHQIFLKYIRDVMSEFFQLASQVINDRCHAAFPALRHSRGHQNAERLIQRSARLHSSVPHRPVAIHVRWLRKRKPLLSRLAVGAVLRKALSERVVTPRSHEACWQQRRVLEQQARQWVSLVHNMLIQKLGSQRLP